MKAIYQNLTHEKDPDNGREFEDFSEASRLFKDGPHTIRPFSFSLIAENGFKLTVGLETDFGYLEYAPSDGSPPYLGAVHPLTAPQHLEDMEFLVGGTPTPVDGRLRVPIEMVEAIVQEFLATGERSRGVEWEAF
jgi:hypothetical protein